MLLIFLPNLKMGGSGAVAVVVPELAMSKRNSIELLPERRNIELSYEDRNIDMPPLSRESYL